MPNRQTALITGGNRGIGLATAKAFAKRGFRVIVTARDADRGLEAISAIKKFGEAELRLLDVKRSEQVQSLGESLKKSNHHIDVIVNNAGIFTESRNQSGQYSSDPLQVSTCTILELVDVNTLGPLRIIQSLVPSLHRGSRVINVSSGLGALTDMNGSHLGYRISKAGLNVLTRVLAHDLAKDGILVYSICPGWVRTDMGGDNARHDPEEAAEDILWLASNEPAPESGLFYRHKKIIPW